jgi:hypothetical protein
MWKVKKQIKFQKFIIFAIISINFVFINHNRIEKYNE